MASAAARIHPLLVLGVAVVCLIPVAAAARIPPVDSTAVLAATARQQADGKNEDACSIWEDCYTNLFQEDIKPGETGPCVDVLQQALDMPQPSGVYDEATQADVRQFQEAEKLTVQVDIGTETWDAIGRRLLSCDSAGVAHEVWAAAGVARLLQGTQS